ncbi:MAG: 3-oxoacyl-[acyl-carrier-protein] reductase [Clostridiales Family XIII bacterium]|jgi:3-oxoacyl-[acyl-carrier protein] reductase|nr:3-oxoacyl-[acyl-carrier-protein] reductase [Clostridiales Family XIII bacterium]
MLHNKSAIITGGTRGIGRAAAIEFAKNGADLLLTYRGNDEAAAEIQKLLEPFETRIELLRGDAASADFARSAVNRAKDIFGKVDILVNNAGITNDKLLLRMKPEDFDRVIQTNLNGAFYMLQAAAPLMTKNRAGRVINLSSVSGLRGNPGQVNYSASKAGLVGMTLSAAKELGARNITVNAVAPGFIETDMTDILTDAQREAALSQISLGRAGHPEEVAKLLAFLASDDAAYITGQVIGIDGGMVI